MKAIDPDLIHERAGVLESHPARIAEPQPADLKTKPYKTMMVVIGSTAKGLGASGITIDQEIERLGAGLPPEPGLSPLRALVAHFVNDFGRALRRKLA